MDYQEYYPEKLYIKTVNPDHPGGYVYLIQLGDTDIFKIGITRNLIRRLDQLQRKCPIPLNPIYQWYGHDYEYAERYLHDMFWDKRVKGEWFKLDAADLIAISNVMPDDFEHSLHRQISRKN